MAESEFSASAMNEKQGLPPSPSVENPGRVFPRYSSVSGQADYTASRKTMTPEQYVGNPFLMNAALDRLDHAFGEVISILEQETNSNSAGAVEDTDGKALLEKFRNLRSEVEKTRLGDESLPERLPSTRPVSVNALKQEGGMFAD